jgi:hypothetical protein
LSGSEEGGVAVITEHEKTSGNSHGRRARRARRPAIVFKAVRSDGGFLHLKCARVDEHGQESPHSWLLMSVNLTWVPDEVAYGMIEDATRRLRPTLEEMANAIHVARERAARGGLRLMSGGRTGEGVGV